MWWEEGNVVSILKSTINLPLAFASWFLLLKVPVIINILPIWISINLFVLQWSVLRDTDSRARNVYQRNVHLDIERLEGSVVSFSYTMKYMILLLSLNVRLKLTCQVSYVTLYNMWLLIAIFVLQLRNARRVTWGEERSAVCILKSTLNLPLKFHISFVLF